jgi:hypothetical protein
VLLQVLAKLGGVKDNKRIRDLGPAKEEKKERKANMDLPSFGLTRKNE